MTALSCAKAIAAGVLIAVASAAAAYASSSVSTGTRLLRFPDVCGDRVVFTYAGDLWTASTQGGTAMRLTAGPGLEQSARFSPDCKTVAFTGEYGGDDQVYIIPAEGGEPKQLTYYPAYTLEARWGFDNEAIGWTPDGKSVLFHSFRETRDLVKRSPRLFTVPVEGGLPTALPMPTAGAGRYSPDGKQFVYSPTYRAFRTWNRYVGGWAEDLYIYDFAKKSAVNITNDPNTDRDPVWIGNGVYFLADRGEHLNLYRYDTGSGETRQLTDFKGADARWASGGDKGRIVFEVDGVLHLYDTTNDTDRTLQITVPSDLVATRAEERSVAANIEDFSLSANGKRVLFVARGELFSAPVKDGITLNLTHTPGTHEREASWSADGKRVVYVSDRSGEEEIWIRNADGSNPVQITGEVYGRLYRPLWSPDGAHIAFGDNSNLLHVVALGGGNGFKADATTRGVDDERGARRDYVWSPSGRYLAYTVTDKDSQLSQLFVYDSAANKSMHVGDEHFDAHCPAFSPDGKFLFFLGDREWAPQISTVEWDFATNRSTGIYAMALRKAVANPFAPRDDAAGSIDDGDANNRAESGKPNASKPPTEGGIDDTIDFDGLDQRLVRVPVEPNNIGSLAITQKAIFYVVSDARYFGREGAFRPTLMKWTFAERKGETLFEGVDSSSMAADGNSILVQSEGQYKRIDLNAAKAEPQQVKTEGLFTLVDPKAEYDEIFREVWRRFRDHFYAANMNGYDWTALRAKYEPLVGWVGDRTDLNYLMGQMVAELNSGHTYVGGGDLGLPAKPHVGLIGARFELDAKSGLYKIAKILEGENDEERYRSPLTELGVDVHLGDYILAINGQTLGAHDDPYRLLRIAPGQLVQLTVNTKPADEGARTVLVRPIEDEQPLSYYAWVKHNREYVDKATHGEIGYVDLEDEEADGIREFIKWYYPQLRKQALILDVRDNGGGSVSQWIIGRLSRKLLGLRYERGTEVTGTYPQQVFLGHLVAICSGTSASDGDVFSYMFKTAHLGPLIGTRTWGGTVGITDWGPTVDGGEIDVAQFALANNDGQYVVEGHGVDPDIVVEDDIADNLAGRDPQLDRAIEEAKKAVLARPFKMPPRPQDPVKAPPDMRPQRAQPSH